MDLRYRMLDPLRGLAALWVFVFHFPFCDSFQQTLPWLHSLLKFGDRGVPIFFVISGYCLSASAAGAMRRSESATRFLFRRAMRIYPTFWCSIAFITVTHFLLVAGLQATTGEVPFPLAGRFNYYSAGVWLQVASLTQIFDRDFGFWFQRFGSVNGAYWTLAIEFQFYVVMAVAVWRPKVFTPIITLVSLASVTAYWNRDFYVMTAGSGWFLPFWSWFAFGILLYQCFQRQITPERLFGRWTSVATLSLLGLITGVCVASVLFGVSIERFLFAAAFAVMLWLAKPWNDRWTAQIESGRPPLRLLSNSLLVLGTMSYSLYLVHNQIWQSFLAILGQLGVPRSIAGDLFIVVATCLICYPFYLVCEAPILSLSARQRNLRQSRSMRESWLARVAWMRSKVWRPTQS